MKKIVDKTSCIVFAKKTNVLLEIEKILPGFFFPLKHFKAFDFMLELKDAKIKRKKNDAHQRFE